ncbi:MAG: DUF6502 family protein [Myxococcota bacterium]
MSQPLMQALVRLLRPLVRLLLAKQIAYPVFANLLKSVYVVVAEDEFRLEEKRQTDSRISLLTGIHRKDVKRLRGEHREDVAAPPSVSLGGQLVARWAGMPEFQDAEGRPLPLPRHASGAEGQSFDTLVESVSTDIRPRAVLDEWLRLGVAGLDDDDRVVLNAEAFVPETGFEEKAFFFGRNLHDHIAAGAHNLLGATPPFVERSVYYGRLSHESIQELARLSEEKGMEALQAVNRRALELQKCDAGSALANHRVNFGIYFFDAEVADPTDEESDEA